MSKGQSAMEFIILVATMFFFFLTFLFIIQAGTAEKTKENRTDLTYEIALSVQTELNLATESTDGYSRTFYIPINILGAEYDIDVEEGIVYARTEDGKHAVVLPVPEVTGNILKGENTIRKNDGTVFLNE